MKCRAKTEVYSRVCGYYRPVSQWNDGKREEQRLRKPFKLRLGEKAAEKQKDEG